MRGKTRNQRFRLVALVFLLLILPIILVFLQFQQDFRQRADETAHFALIPSAATVQPGEELHVAIYIDSLDQLMNGVQVRLTYPAAKMNLEKIDFRNTSFPTKEEMITRNGYIDFVQTSSTVMNGRQYVGTLSFRAAQTVTPSEIVGAPGLSYIAPGYKFQTAAAEVLSPNSTDPNLKKPSFIESFLNLLGL